MRRAGRSSATQCGISSRPETKIRDTVFSSTAPSSGSRLSRGRARPFLSRRLALLHGLQPGAFRDSLRGAARDTLTDRRLEVNVAWQLDQLADAIDRLRRLNADLRDTAADSDARRVLSDRQRAVKAEVVAAFRAVRTAAAAGDEDAKELLRALEE